MGSRMIKRPLSITILAWFFIVTGVVTIILHTLLIRDEHQMKLLNEQILLPVWIQISIGYIGAIIGVIGGIGLIKGKNWARIIYVVWGLGVVLFYLEIPSIPLNPFINFLVIYAVVMFFLFRPKANNYFKQKTP